MEKIDNINSFNNVLNNTDVKTYSIQPKQILEENTYKKQDSDTVAINNEKQTTIQTTVEFIDTSELDISMYAQKFEKQLKETLGPNYEKEINELKELESQIENLHGIKIKIELNDDVFENKDKLMGFKNLLQYVDKKSEEFQARSIKEINIVDEWDNLFGVKVDLEYEKNKGRSLTLGDDFLDDWGESGKADDKDSIGKITKELGEKLSDAELMNRTKQFNDLKQPLLNVLKELDNFQNDPKKLPDSITQNLADIEKNIPNVLNNLEKIKINDEKELSIDYLNRFKNTVNKAKEEIKSLENEKDPFLQKARAEKIKNIIISGADLSTLDNNYIKPYINGSNESVPGIGLGYHYIFGKEGQTDLSLNAGFNVIHDASNILKNKNLQSLNYEDYIMGLNLGHNVSSNNQFLNGTKINAGVGIGLNTPLLAGVSVENSWYVGKYSPTGSATGGYYASVGSYNNVGIWLDDHKNLTDNIDFEGSAELSGFNQSLEGEVEFNILGNKDLYLTAGFGTNKLIYAGIGIADKYELEVGLGGISFGKDSNNLPGEKSWEVGIRSYMPLIPFFKNHRMPGCNFTYPDKSKEYVSPNGLFILEKNGKRDYYTPIDSSANDRSMSFKINKSNDLRVITVNDTGYLTVKDGDQTIVKDGQLQKKMTSAELGIIVDQAGVLWYDKLSTQKESDIKHRREDIPLPLLKNY